MTSISLFFIIRSCDSYIVCCSSELCCTNIVILSRRLSATERYVKCDQEKTERCVECDWEKCDWEKDDLE